MVCGVSFEKFPATIRDALCGGNREIILAFEVTVQGLDMNATLARDIDQLRILKSVDREKVDCRL